MLKKYRGQITDLWSETLLKTDSFQGTFQGFVSFLTVSILRNKSEWLLPHLTTNLLPVRTYLLQTTIKSCLYNACKCRN